MAWALPSISFRVIIVRSIVVVVMMMVIQQLRT